MFPLPNMEEPAAKKTRSSPLLPDWSQLPKELLEIITDNVNCFDIVHARSVCTSWRSTSLISSSESQLLLLSRLPSISLEG
ncbi:BnaC04g37180D [Brassica napus]|uniref:BnaC04g37180D protein n=1 Tax=Brassica napus TaxID=3708 RepID=A0A078HEH2_BRANA|nr:BnaC04g37180D [Brassica napus]